MERGQGLRILRRVVERMRVEIGKAGATDPGTGELFGSLNAEEAVACGRATVGRHTYGAFTIHVGRGERARVHIGAFCSIAIGVEFVVGGNHRTDWISTYPFRVLWGMPGAWTDGHPRPESDIEVGNDVWIGAQALILPGVKIGDGAVIGARAVVTRDVRPYAIVAGVPAREVRRRFGDEQVDALIALCWWDWPEERIRANVDLLCSPEVDALGAPHPLRP
ncbi:MAG TPA: CatB-related O-acetyltransferase [Solirubrobacteraceae bacterium]